MDGSGAILRVARRGNRPSGQQAQMRSWSGNICTSIGRMGLQTITWEIYVCCVRTVIAWGLLLVVLVWDMVLERRHADSGADMRRKGDVLGRIWRNKRELISGKPGGGDFSAGGRRTNTEIGGVRNWAVPEGAEL